MANRIKVGVGGRFHADQLALALYKRGWDVSVITSFPKNRFKNLPKDRIETAFFPEIIYRVTRKINEVWASDFKMVHFGRAFSRACNAKREPGIVLGWSSFSLEAFKRSPHNYKVLVRDSAHIQEQVSILKSEYALYGLKFPDRSVTISRELEEYKLADKIIVLSEVTKRSFIKWGVSENKLSVIRLGVDVSRFKPRPTATPRTGPLRVVYFGTISIRKGVLHLLRAMDSFSPEVASLVCIGEIDPELRGLISGFRNVQFEKPLPHPELAKRLQAFDVFVLPSVEDGFGMVVPQAMAAGLVPIISTAAGASELIKDGINGFLIPPKDPEAIVKTLKPLIQDREKIDTIRRELVTLESSLSWENYGKDFDTVLREGMTEGSTLSC